LSFSEVDERFHAPGPEEQWSDSLYFGGGDERTTLYTRVGRRPNEDRVEGALGIWLSDGRFVLSFGREPDSDQIAAGPVAYACALPFELWRIDVSGTARAYSRAEDLAAAPESFEEVELGGNLRFAAWTDPVTFGSGLTGAVASHHYEQPGSLAGVLEVGGERVPIAGRGVRDHSWGVRDWQAVPYWRWFGIVVDPDNFLMINNVGTPDGGETCGGLVMRDGVAPRWRPARPTPSSTPSWDASGASPPGRPMRSGARSSWRVRPSASLRCDSGATAG